MKPFIPPWACPRFGSYGHDWMDCCECQLNYDDYIEEVEEQ